MNKPSTSFMRKHFNFLSQTPFIFKSSPKMIKACVEANSTMEACSFSTVCGYIILLCYKVNGIVVGADGLIRKGSDWHTSMYDSSLSYVAKYEPLFHYHAWCCFPGGKLTQWELYHIGFSGDQTLCWCTLKRWHCYHCCCCCYHYSCIIRVIVILSVTGHVV